MLKGLKKYAKNFFMSRGYELKKCPNPTGISNNELYIENPIEAGYLSRGASVFLNVPLERCIQWSYLAFPCIPGSCSPYIQTLAQYRNGECAYYKGSPLETFYNAYKPSSLSEFMGLESPENHVLMQVRPTSDFGLWYEKSPFDAEKSRKKCTFEEHKKYDRSIKRHDDVDPLYGPISDKSGEIEFIRLISIYEKIKENGYQVDPKGRNNPGVVALISDNDSPPRYLVRGGQHRFAVLAALDYTSALVQLRTSNGLSGILHRRDSKSWPVVKSGYLTEKEALFLFDRLYYGKQPEFYLKSIK